MKPEFRRHAIVEMLVEEGTVSLDDLARRFAVSKMTVHRDLDALEAHGLLRKVRGGATVEASGQFESDFRYRSRIAAEEKRRVAARAAQFLEPGMSVMIDDGSTAHAAAPFVIAKRPITVITNNLALIDSLSGASGVRLISLGGSYARTFNGFFGAVTEAALAGLRADVALLSSSAILGGQVFHQDQEVLAVKRRMIASSSRCYLMADHRKFGRTALHLLCGLDRFDGVVTSDALGAETVKALRRDGIALHLAEGA